MLIYLNGSQTIYCCILLLYEAIQNIKGAGQCPLHLIKARYQNQDQLQKPV